MYFEEFSQGDTFATRSRVVTGTDMDIFAVLTGATNPLFLNEEFGKKQGFNGRIAPGILILALAVGAQYSMGLFDHIIAFLGIDKLRFLSHRSFRGFYDEEAGGWTYLNDISVLVGT
jgi:3-hydroxybutyryl-CoA dehydratase